MWMAKKKYVVDWADESRFESAFVLPGPWICYNFKRNKMPSII
jgi:hypothetical protein